MGMEIVFYLKIIRASINSKRLLKLLDDKDKSWNYRNIEQQVINTFYSVQESWTNMDMSASKEYMADDLYENFNTKLEWMQMGNKRNVLKKIKLINLKPISIYDDEDPVKEEKQQPLVETIQAHKDNNPEEIFLNKEYMEKMQKQLQGKLSDLESRVLYLHLLGEDYKTIAGLLNKSPKSIDNTLQRIKNKITALVKKK